MSQVAAVVEQDSLFCVPNTHSTLTSCAIEWPRIEELPYLGAPVDHYELHVVLDRDLPYRMYLFLNAYRLDAETREAMRRMRRPGRTLVYMYAQGFLSPDEPTASAENIAALTGFKMRRLSGTRSGRIVLTENARLLGLTPGDEIGQFDKPVEGGMGFARNGDRPYPAPNQTLDPVFAVDDPDAVVLGVYKDTGEPAFAMKEKDGCTLVYLGAAAPTVRVIRALARRAGIHLFCGEDCFTFANESYVGLHAPHDGLFELCLPEKRGLREVFTGETFAPASRIPLALKKGETRLFAYDD